jgi:beta-lactamase class A
MRERRKPLDKKRNSRQSEKQNQSAASRRSAKDDHKPLEARRSERRDRNQRPGGFFGLLGGNSSNRRQRRARPQSNAAGTATNRNRLVDLQSRRPTPVKATVVPLRSDKPRRNPFQRRQAEPQTQELIKLPPPRSKSGKFFLNAIRLVIFGVGLGVLAGTMMSIWDPASNLTAGAAAGDKPAETRSASTTEDFKLGQEMTQLKAQLTSLTEQNKTFKPGILLLDLDNNAYVDINANEAFPAASTIKFPLLVAFFQDVDAGKIQLGESLVMKKEQVATEAGNMQYQPVGTQFSAIETATNMMVVSDNTATNMLIERLGGMTAVSQRFKSWGMNATTVSNLLPDVQGQNTTSPKDLAKLMSQVQSGKLVSMKSRDRILDIMRRVENDTMLPRGLGNGATIAHKTGTLGVLLGDIGLIDTPNGKRYLASVLVQRPRDDAKAEEMIQQISKMAYQSFTQPQSAQSFDRPRIAQPVN